MKKIEIIADNVLTAFRNADKNGKQIIKDLVGNQVDFNQKITDRIKTFEDACEVLGIDTTNCESSILLNYNGKDRDLIAAQAHAKISIIARALNEGWQPDWTDSSQYKYYPWFNHKSGFGLSYDYYGYFFSFTFVGSRLCYSSSELAIYAAKQFAEIYRDLMTL